ncbi:hypothetical protein [Desulfovibrio litoralis]|uniref:Uncharacterized protein n=1 Tax=Desulfovibrio litoralis DSM 11393 TaxID=1121455 RepID=A0A1M7SS26_9BACT|nr:hypothetical protein [Desulfovibrio litoralis]SHN61279.1 hypothetical protein SAMN02745728_01208 [Desulfovibrio litoralis DSM 11393]
MLKKIILSICFVLFLSTNSFAATIENISYINLLSSWTPWTVNINSKQEVTWDNGSSGRTFTESTEKKATKISDEDYKTLIGLIEKMGYDKKIPLGTFAIEPKIILELTFSDGKKIINLGPGSMESDSPIFKDFAKLETIIYKLNKEMGVDGLNSLMFYNKNN